MFVVNAHIWQPLKNSERFGTGQRSDSYELYQKIRSSHWATKLSSSIPDVDAKKRDQHRFRSPETNLGSGEEKTKLFKLRDVAKARSRYSWYHSRYWQGDDVKQDEVARRIHHAVRLPFETRQRDRNHPFFNHTEIVQHVNVAGDNHRYGLPGRLVRNDSPTPGAPV